jgi:hypothetical protein
MYINYDSNLLYHYFSNDHTHFTFKTVSLFFLKWFNVRYFLYRNGPFPMLPWPCHKIEYNIQLCLAGLNEVDRYVYNCLKRSKFIYNKTLKKKEILSWMWNGCHVLSGEATNTNFIVLGLTRSGLEPTIYHTRWRSMLTITPPMRLK